MSPISAVSPPNSKPWLRPPAPLLPWQNFTPTTSTKTGLGPVLVATGTGQMSHGPGLSGMLISPRLQFTRVTLSWWLPAVLTAVPPFLFAVAHET